MFSMISESLRLIYWILRTLKFSVDGLPNKSANIRRSLIYLNETFVNINSFKQYASREKWGLLWSLSRIFFNYKQDFDPIWLLEYLMHWTL
jgi:hypothetical protein